MHPNRRLVTWDQIGTNLSCLKMHIDFDEEDQFFLVGFSITASFDRTGDTLLRTTGTAIQIIDHECRQLSLFFPSVRFHAGDFLLCHHPPSSLAYQLTESE